MILSFFHTWIIEDRLLSVFGPATNMAVDQVFYAETGISPAAPAMTVV